MAVVDPTEAGREAAAENGVPWHSSFRDMLAAERADGVIVATPNQVHVENGLEAVAAGIPIWWKSDRRRSRGGQRLVAAAEQAGVPLLVGHHPPP